MCLGASVLWFPSDSLGLLDGLHSQWERLDSIADSELFFCTESNVVLRLVEQFRNFLRVDLVHKVNRCDFRLDKAHFLGVEASAAAQTSATCTAEGAGGTCADGPLERPLFAGGRFRRADLLLALGEERLEHCCGAYKQLLL